LLQLPNLPRELRSSQVLIRFGLRMIILVAFAGLGGAGFGRSLSALLWMSIILCAVVGTIRLERPLDGVLNHWDEAAAYAAMFFLVSVFDHPVPI
jgi:hypothetical protein